jgi:ubiquinone/menaquinone biosynthesis C-methylase UbiE
VAVPPDLSMQSYYAARAGEYDRVYQKPERQSDLRQIEQWLPTLLSGATVLEVACGTGYWTQFIAPVASAVVAIDSAPETLQIAQQRVNASNVLFQVGDAYALSGTGHAFDAAFAGFCSPTFRSSGNTSSWLGSIRRSRPVRASCSWTISSWKAVLLRSPSRMATATRINTGS